MELDDFIKANTVVESAPLVPEIRLHLATELTPLWHATESYLNQSNIGAPFWAFAWIGGQALARFILDEPDAIAGLHVVVCYTRGESEDLTDHLRKAAAPVLFGDPGRQFMPREGIRQVATYSVETSQEIEANPITEASVWRMVGL